MTYIPPNPNGQATMANSQPVVVASNQSSLPVTQLTPSNLNTVVYGYDGSGNPALSMDSSGKANINNISGTVSLPTGAATSANQTNGTQQAKITDGTNVAGVTKNDGTTTGAMNVLNTGSSGFTGATVTLNAASPSSPWFDLLNYPSLSIEILTNTAPSTLTFQTSGDASQTNITSMSMQLASNQTSGASPTTTSATGTFYGNRMGRYFRINSNVSGGNTVTFAPTFYTSATAPMSIGVNLQNTVNATSQTGSTVPSGAFYQGAQDGSGNLVGLKAIAHGLNTATGVPAAGMVAEFDDTSPTGTTENQFSPLRMSANRNLYGTIRDAAGNERGLNISAQNAAAVGGSTASGSSLVEAPVTGGGLAKTANPTAVSDGQVVNSLHDKLGKQVVVGSIRDLKGDAPLTLTATTTETTLIAAVASTFLDVYGVIVTNTSATACEVVFRDVTAGTPRFSIEVPPTDTRGFMLPESAAYKQATVNTAWTAQCGTSVSSIKISALYVKNT